MQSEARKNEDEYKNLVQVVKVLELVWQIQGPSICSFLKAVKALCSHLWDIIAYITGYSVPFAVGTPVPL
jgi:hypothetical protein